MMGREQEGEHEATQRLRLLLLATALADHPPAVLSAALRVLDLAAADAYVFVGLESDCII